MKNKAWFRLAFIPVIVACTFSSFAYSQSTVTQEWIRFLGAGASNPESSKEEAIDMVVDSQGNTYQTGTSESGGDAKNYVTIKRDPDGNIVWTHSAHGLKNGFADDEASSMCIDSLGNVYVTGSSFIGPGKDYYTVKIDPNGQELWGVRFTSRNVGFTKRDTPVEIAVDTIGNVYVTGIAAYSNSRGSVQSYLTVKYDKNGKELWNIEWDNQPVSKGGASGMAVDNSGNVYVSGPFIIKYDTFGQEIWNIRYKTSNQASVKGLAEAIKLGPQGELIVTGDDGTVSYSAEDGNELWRAPINGLCLDINTAENVYVGGENRRLNQSTYETTKINKFGLVEWQNVTDQLQVFDQRVLSLKFYDDRVFVTGTAGTIQIYDDTGLTGFFIDVEKGGTVLQVNDAGDIYVSGTITTNVLAGYTDYNLLKFSRLFGGNLHFVWAQRYNGLGRTGRHAASDLAIDAFGNVIVVGESIVKYDANGNEMWVKSHTVSLRKLPPLNLVEPKVATDDVGNFYVVDQTLQKYDSQGNQLWDITLQYNEEPFLEPSDLALGISGGIYITGAVKKGNQYKYFIGKFDSSGNQMWADSFVELGALNRNDEVLDLALDHLGNAYITGSNHGVGTFADIVTMKYDPNGNVLWKKRLNGPSASSILNLWVKSF